jgi:hypothetical protein
LVMSIHAISNQRSTRGSMRGTRPRRPDCTGTLALNPVVRDLPWGRQGSSAIDALAGGPSLIQHPRREKRS